MITGRKGLSSWSALRDLVSISLSHLHAIVIICTAGHKQIVTATIVVRLTREQFKIILLCFFRIRRISCAWMIQCTNDMHVSITLLVVVMLIGLMFIPRSGYNYSAGRRSLVSNLDVGMRNILWWVCSDPIWFFPLFWKMVTPNDFCSIAHVSQMLLLQGIRHMSVMMQICRFHLIYDKRLSLCLSYPNYIVPCISMRLHRWLSPLSICPLELLFMLLLGHDL